MNNLATAEFHLFNVGQGSIKFPSSLVMTFCACKGEVSHVVIGQWGKDATGAFPIFDFHIQLSDWTRETVLLHLLTHNAEDLAQYDIGYFEAVEVVELPHDFMAAIV